mmetsp:Transcript_25676/g.74070  ORF Transcript_25676/g.74070 Transcript_25676/m.74070 type:complete len:315 (+) Transcript_25676:787-1731(+)
MPRRHLHRRDCQFLRRGERCGSGQWGREQQRAAGRPLCRRHLLHGILPRRVEVCPWMDQAAQALPRERGCISHQGQRFPLFAQRLPSRGGPCLHREDASARRRPNRKGASSRERPACVGSQPQRSTRRQQRPHIRHCHSSTHPAHNPFCEGQAATHRLAAACGQDGLPRARPHGVFGSGVNCADGEPGNREVGAPLRAHRRPLDFRHGYCGHRPGHHPQATDAQRAAPPRPALHGGRGELIATGGCRAADLLRRHRGDGALRRLDGRRVRGSAAGDRADPAGAHDGSVRHLGADQLDAEAAAVPAASGRPHCGV